VLARDDRASRGFVQVVGLTWLQHSSWGAAEIDAGRRPQFHALGIDLEAQPRSSVLFPQDKSGSVYFIARWQAIFIHEGTRTDVREGGRVEGELGRGHHIVRRLVRIALNLIEGGWRPRPGGKNGWRRGVNGHVVVLDGDSGVSVKVVRGEISLGDRW